MKDLFVPIILGTAREHNFSQKVANFVFAEAQNFGFATQILKAKDFAKVSTGIEDEKTKEWKNIIGKSDGLIIVSPEYNHGYPGELKIILDQGYEEYNRKPVGFCGVSSGKLGGVRAIEQLRLVAIELQMVPIRNAVYFSNVEDIFDIQGNILKENYKNKLNSLFEELFWYAKVLKEARG